MFIILLAILVVMIALGIWSAVYRKMLYKEVSQIDSKHYNITELGRISKDNDFICNYYQIKPETYKKIKATPSSSPSFDIQFSDIPVARISVLSPENNLKVNGNVYADELRHSKIDKDSLKLMEMVSNKEPIENNEIVLDLEIDLKQAIEQNNILEIFE